MALLPLALTLLTQTPTAPPVYDGKPLILKEVLAIASVGRGGRIPFPTDSITQEIVRGNFATPRAGLEVQVAGSENRRTWGEAKANEEGWFSGQAFNGGYAYIEVQSPRSQAAVLKAAGYGMVYVNGVPRVGDPYQFGYVQVPVLLKSGKNELLFSTSRGRLRAELTPPKAKVFFNTGDMTVGDIAKGDTRRSHAAILVLNTTEEPLRDLKLIATAEGVGDSPTNAGPIPPMGIRKVGFELPDLAPKEPGEYDVTVRLMDGTETLDTATFKVAVKKPEEKRKVSFISTIDGSVQYFGVTPPTAIKRNLGLVLTVHGAGVEAIGQAQAYGHHADYWIVAPTNRRPFGFDWEDWGRMDALEVLDYAQALFNTDPKRTYITGHSMGGHGAWILGSMFPNRFAATAPSAGWQSFFTYAGGRRENELPPLEALVQRASNISDTAVVLRNLLDRGVYILHGDADDNVPVREAREMKRLLEELGHKDLGYHEQPGAGHWWDGDKAAGADCVDWPPIFEMFQRRLLPDDRQVNTVDFTTVNPAVSDTKAWLRILDQHQPLMPSRVEGQRNPHSLVVYTRNVKGLVVETGEFDLMNKLEIDGFTFDVPRGRTMMVLEHANEKWQVKADATPTARTGPFKEAFKNRMVFVYGTTGTTEENAWSLAKARFDAESFWYRGNGSVDVISDKEALALGVPRPNMVLYGNADTNSAFSMLARSPLTVNRSGFRLGTKALEGKDLGWVFQLDGRFAVVGGAGIEGMRATDRLSYFVSGAAYPDFTVFRSSVHSQGLGGVQGAGYWGRDGGFQEVEWR